MVRVFPPAAPALPVRPSRPLKRSLLPRGTPARAGRGWARGAFGALLLLATAGCPPPSVPLERDLAGVTVAVDPEALTVTVRRGADAVTTLHLEGAASRTANASFAMEFGMSLVEEYDATEWAGPDRMEVGEAGPDDGPGYALGLLRDGQPWLAGAVTAVDDGHLLVRLSAHDPEANRIRVRMACAATDHFAGLGAQSHDVDHRGQRVPLWVSEQGVGKVDTDEPPAVWQLVGRRHTTHVPIPAAVTSRGVALVLETEAYSVFDLCASDEAWIDLEAWEAQARLHIFVGEDPVEALGRMSAFVGRPQLPAPWLHAPWNDAIFGTEAVREFAAFLRAEQIPSSALWSEDFRGGLAFGGGLYRLSEDWGLDEELYPGFADLVADLRADGFAQQLYYNTFVYDDADVHDTAIANRWVVEEEDGDPYYAAGANADFSQVAVLDLTDDDAVEFIKGYLRQGLDYGALGWMADFAEWMPVQRARVESGEDPRLVHNRYPVLWQRANQEVLAERGLEEEAIVFARSGHLFGQGVTQVLWAGDQRTSFADDDGLPTIIPIGLGAAAAGYLFYAHDIAGYQSSTNDPATRELFYRWTELGAFTPVMRTHHGTHTTANWNLRTDEETTAHWKRYAELHIRLYPYARALAERAIDEGVPLWLPGGLLYPDDETLWPLKDQVFFGEALLVAPVVAEGATAREVYLPEGRWAPLRLGGAAPGPAVEGPGWLTADAPLEEIPLFLKAGGLVPLCANTPQTLLDTGGALPDLGSVEGDRVLYVGLGAPGTFREVSGARYTLTGDGTSLAGLSLDADGALTVQGNATVQGEGWTLSLEGHPAGRATRVVLR